MTEKEIKSLCNVMNKLYTEVHENNLMLQEICKVINMYLARHHQENEDDFNRNILANLISGVIDLKGVRK